MIRKQFLLTPEQNARLRAQALASGVSEADIVREGIDLALQRGQADDAFARARQQQAGAVRCLWAVPIRVANAAVQALDILSKT